MVSQICVGMRGYLRLTGEDWGEVVSVVDDEVAVRTQYDNIVRFAFYEVHNWIGDGVLEIVRPEMHEIFMEDRRIFFADTVVESPGKFTAYWKRGVGSSEIGMKVISPEKISKIVQGGNITFENTTPRKVKTQADKRKEASELAIRLAERGIYAMYGGVKGHGFWCYSVGVEVARKLVACFDARLFWEIADAFEETPIIKNDGKKSGNPCFWMFSDAIKLAEVPVAEG